MRETSEGQAEMGFIFSAMLIAYLVWAVYKAISIQESLTQQQKNEAARAAQIGAASAALYHTHKDKVADNKLFDSEVGKFIQNK
jgi:7-keto-8-aminopelargonate synthetase-like enzyme